MYKNKTVGVVVPAYNEEGYVGEVIDTLPQFIDRAYVVDDGSTDDTWAEIEEHAARYNAEHTTDRSGFDAVVEPIQHETNRGVGGALKTGYLAALEEGVEVTAVLGGDGQMNPDVLKRYLDPVVEGDADYAKGNRFMKHEDLEAMPRFRLVGNSILSYLTKFASGYWKTMDPQNGYTAISHEALRRADIENMYEYYGYCNDLLVKLNVENMRVADVACSSTFVYDDDWKSHIDYSEYIPKVSWMLLCNFFWRLKRKYLLQDFHPLAVCYGLGTVVSGAGAVGFLASLRDRERSSPVGWFLTVLFGLSFLLTAVVLDMDDNAHLEQQVDDDAYGESDGESSDDAPPEAAYND